MEPVNEAGGVEPVLARAAQTIAAISGVAETVVDVVHGRALRHYGEGLRQYLAIRLADVNAAGDALSELRAIVAARPAKDLASPPGMRARLYRIARKVTDQRRTGAGLPSGAARAELPWRPARPGTPAARVDALARIRTELGEADAELLELRHARELSPEEIAFVVDRPEGDVLEHMDEATQRAEGLAGGGIDEGGLRQMLLEAFALEPRQSSVKSIDIDEVLAPLEAGTIIGGRYEVDARVGSGAFADVYRAKDTEVPGHVVALKLLHQASLSDQARASALRELHLIASVFHPSIVQFKDHGWYESRLWFVMPWYEGETLEARIERAPLSRAEARRVFEPLARALAAMHAVGIRHQDVKPDNIFLARIAGFGGTDGEEEVLPVLLDLGVAAKEAEMVVAGTPTYFAPEVAAQFASSRGARLVTVKADVFSLALSLRNALEPDTQEDVAAGAVEAFIVRRATEAPDTPVSNELRFLDPFLERWMSLDPDERPTADELGAELAILTRPEERRARRVAILRWAVPLVLAVAVVFASAVYALNQRAQRQKVEAERAKVTAASLREDLSMSEQQKAELKRNMQTLQDSYDQGKLSRRQLASKLATAETNLGVVRRGLSGSEQQRHTLEGQLSQTRRQLSTARTTLASTRSDLDDARNAASAAQARAQESETQRKHLEAELTSARTDAEQARQHAADLDGQVAALRSQLEAEKAKSGRLESDMEAAVAARARAESDLAAARQRITRLEHQLAAGGGDQSAGAGGGASGGGGSGPTATPAPGATAAPSP